MSPPNNIFTDDLIAIRMTDDFSRAVLQRIENQLHPRQPNHSSCLPNVQQEEPSPFPKKWPYEYIKIYDFPKQSFYCRKKPTIGVIMFGGSFSLDEIHLNWALNGVPTCPCITTKEIVGTMPPFGDNLYSYDIANTYALSLIGTLCPCSNIIVYWADRTTTNANPYENMEAVLNQIAIDKPSIVVSNARISENLLKSLPNGPSFMKNVNCLFKKCNKNGTTFIFSTGNFGSSNIYNITTVTDVNFPASSPWVVACGGTSFVDANNQPCDEYAWSANNGGSYSLATGGGYSTFFSGPCYQKGIVPDNTYRALPDMAITANPGIFFVYDNNLYTIIGTGIAAIILSGLLARINKTYKYECSFNHVMYEIYKDGCTIFKDITVGTNNTVQNINLYPATTGYDLCTGLGVPIGKAIDCTISFFPHPGQ